MGGSDFNLLALQPLWGDELLGRRVRPGRCHPEPPAPFRIQTGTGFVWAVGGPGRGV